MRVLVTRPAEAAVRTAAALAAEGIEAVFAPIVEVRPTGAVWPAGVVDAIVASSAHAFDILHDAQGPRPEARRLLPVFCVGARTAAAAAAAGYEGRTSVAPDADHLVHLVRDGCEPGRRLLYLAGRDRKPLLETALPALGLTLDVLEVYDAKAAERIDPAVAARLADGSIAAVLHYSRRSAGLFRDLAAAAGLDPSGLLHICISGDAAEPLFNARYHRIAIAAEPDETAMIALLCAFLPQAGSGAPDSDGEPAGS